MVKVVKDNRSAAFKAVTELVKTSVGIGFPDDSAPHVSPDGKTSAPMPLIAYVQEYGEPSHNIPPRPFIVPGIESVKPQITKLLIRGAQRALAGDASAAYDTFTSIGLIGENGIKQKISDGPFEPLAPATVYRRMHRKKAPRNSDQPLIDTGQLRQAVRYVIRKK